MENPAPVKSRCPYCLSCPGVSPHLDSEGAAQECPYCDDGWVTNNPGQPADDNEQLPPSQGQHD